MTSSCDGGEKTPLLPPSTKDEQPSFSIIRARIVSVVLPVLTLSAGGARDTLMAQYIVAKLANERGVVNNETTRPPCNVDANDSRAHEADELEAEAAEFLTNLGFAMCGPAFLSCILIGSYSDFLGRRVGLILPTLGYLLRMLITAAIVKWDLDLNYLYAAYAVDGVSGSWFAMLVGLFSLTADISATKRGRTFWINIISCSATIVTAGSNIAVGYLIGSVGWFYACLLLLSMTGLAFIIVVFTLQETLPAHKRPKTLGRNPLVYMKRVVAFYFFDGTPRKRATFCVCLSVFVVGVASELNLGSMDALYQLRRPFCWSSSQIGNYSAIRSAGTAFLGTVLLKLLQCCITEEKIGLLAILSQGVAMTFEAFIQVDWHFYLVPVLYIPEPPFCPIVRSLLSMLAGPDKQGALFASIAIVESLCNLVSLTAFNKIFAATVSYMPGAVYLVMASCGYTAFVLFCIYFCVREPQSRHHVLILNVDPEKEKSEYQTDHQSIGSD